RYEMESAKKLKESLQNSQRLTDSMLTILGSFDTCISSLNSAVLRTENGDFEAPPGKIRVNESNQRAVLFPSNTLSGWEFGGVVEYVKGGGNISLADNGHGIQLGEDGWISQSFRSEPDSLYLLTFTFTAAETDCWWSPSYLILSVPPHSTAFYLQERYGHESWETHGWGFRATTGKTNVKFSSQAQSYANIYCGPLLDAVYLKEQEHLETLADNILLNGDFEQGPYLYPKSTRGVLLHPLENRDAETSSLPGWKIKDTVKYIDIDKGNRGIEIVSGSTGGIEQRNVLSAEDNGPAAKQLSLVHETLNNNRSQCSSSKLHNNSAPSQRKSFEASKLLSKRNGEAKSSPLKLKRRIALAERLSLGGLIDRVDSSGSFRSISEDESETQGHVCYLLTMIYQNPCTEKHYKSKYCIIRGIVLRAWSQGSISISSRVIWLGDLNYRLALHYAETKRLVGKNDWEALLEKDQLRNEKKAGRVFKGWNEGKIYFLPNYKYSRNSDHYAGENVRSRSKRRTPA
ncbi:hypothetical protein KI387_019238, partial [Taxus chinensis]